MPSARVGIYLSSLQSLTRSLSRSLAPLLSWALKPELLAALLHAQAQKDKQPDHMAGSTEGSSEARSEGSARSSIVAVFLNKGFRDRYARPSDRCFQRRTERRQPLLRDVWYYTNLCLMYI